MKYWLTGLFLAISLNSFSQSEPPFSKAAMYADFDTLVSKLKAVSPHIAIKKDLWKYDAIAQVKKLRKQIDTISTRHSFAVLIERALNACQDFHTSIWYVPFEPRQNRQQVKLFLPVSYFNGRYYLTSSVIAGNDTVPAGAVITAADDIPIHQYVQQHLTDKVCSYDMQHRRFYSNRFYRNTTVQQEGQIRLTAISAQKIKKQFVLPAGERAKFVRSIYQDTLRQKVEYWPEQQLLYIRVFSMEANDIPFFVNKISSFKDKAAALKKVIVDIRDNQGGEDTVWIAIYQAILPKKIFSSRLSGYYPSFLDSEYIAEHNFNISKITKNSNPVLKKYNLYDYTHATDSIVPSAASLNFTGKFIVLGNENIYSAGASAMMIPNADDTDPVISVGRKTDLFIGSGYSPVVFELPNSKIQYRIAPSVETDAVKKLSDLMQDTIEVEVPWNLEDFYTKEKYKGDAYGTWYLQHMDSFIKIALQL